MKTLRLLTLLGSGLLLATGALRAQSTDPAEWIKQGDALDRKLKTAESLVAYQQADKLAPNRPDILCKIAREYGLSMEDTAKDAEKKQRAQLSLEAAQKALAIDPNFADAQLSMAICYGRLAPFMDSKTKIGYSKLVKEHVDKALKLDPNNDLSWHVLGVWNYELANLNGFLRAIASALYGKVPDASNEDAVKYLQKALVLNPKRVGNHVELGKAYAALGKKEEAKASLQKGLATPTTEKDDEHEKQVARDVLKKL